MAISKLKPRHASEGRSIAAVLAERIDYSKNPEKKGKHYAEWSAEKKGQSWKALLRQTIDQVLPTVSTFDEFLEAMRKEGYEVAQSSKLLKFRAQGQERFTRSKTLGADYTLEALHNQVGKAKQPRRKKKIRLEKDTRINLLMDIQARLQGRGPGMERWMKIHNLKEAAKTLNYLTKHGITDYDLLAEKAEKAAADFETISTSIKQAEYRMEQIAALKPHIINYAKTRDTLLPTGRKKPMRITSGCARRTKNCKQSSLTWTACSIFRKRNIRRKRKTRNKTAEKV